MRDEALVKITGSIGDMVLLHPLTLHSVSNNKLRELRIITNPPSSSKEAFQPQQQGCNYPVVEQKILKELDMPQGIDDGAVTNEKDRIIRLKAQPDMRRKGLARLKVLGDITMKQSWISRIIH